VTPLETLANFPQETADVAQIVEDETMDVDQRHGDPADKGRRLHVYGAVRIPRVEPAYCARSRRMRPGFVVLDVLWPQGPQLPLSSTSSS
jgi:hypothetical protein